MSEAPQARFIREVIPDGFTGAAGENEVDVAFGTEQEQRDWQHADTTQGEHGKRVALKCRCAFGLRPRLGKAALQTV